MTMMAIVLIGFMGGMMTMVIVNLYRWAVKQFSEGF